MKGFVRMVAGDKRFGFIRCGDSDYFFHKEDYLSHWDDLVEDINSRHVTVEVEFESLSTPKGPRARNVTRMTEFSS